MTVLLEKMRDIESVVVEQGSIFDDLKRIDHELTKVLYSGKGRALIISGNAGTGKTTLLNKSIEQTRTRFKNEGIVSEPVYFQTTASMRGKSFYTTFLNALGTPFADSAELHKLSEIRQLFEIRTMLKSRNIRLLIMDEFQHITERMGDARVQETSDNLKTMLNDIPVLMIFAGTSKVTALLKNEQFASRGTLITKEQMTLKTPKDFLLFKYYLMSLQEHASLDGIPFDHDLIALAIFYESRGDLRIVTDIIKNAILEASSSGRSKVSKIHFQKSWKPRYEPKENKLALVGNTFKHSIDQIANALGITYDI